MSTVSKIQYDEETHLFTWNSVENAGGYVVEINGNQDKVDTNSVKHIITTEETNVRIKAFDPTGRYKDSKWSKTYTYTLGEEFSYSKVCAYINNVFDSYPLKKIVSAYVKDSSLFINGVFNDDGEWKLMKVKVQYNVPVNSVKEAIKQDNYSERRILGNYVIADYDSASYLLESNSFVGEMEKRRLEGFEFSVVSSGVTKSENGKSFYIFAIYKLTKGDNVMYIQSVVQPSIKEPSSSERVNFTTRLLNPDNYRLYEHSYVELTGGDLELAMEMEKLKNA